VASEPNCRGRWLAALANWKKSSPGLISGLSPKISKPQAPKCRPCSGSSPRAKVNRPPRIISAPANNEARSISSPVIHRSVVRYYRRSSSTWSQGLPFAPAHENWHSRNMDRAPRGQEVKYGRLLALKRTFTPSRREVLWFRPKSGHLISVWNVRLWTRLRYERHVSRYDSLQCSF
jgi:hypothetical protein